MKDKLYIIHQDNIRLCGLLSKVNTDKHIIILFYVLKCDKIINFIKEVL